MLDSRGLIALSAVVTCGSFEKAAGSLCITQSAVSQRIKLLEEKLGHTLLIRSAPPKPTPAGASVLKFAQQQRQLESTLMKELNPKALPGWLHISIAVNADTLATWLLKDCLSEWCKQENVLIDIKVDDQDQTHQLLQNGNVIGCISAAESPPQGCRSESIGSCTYIAVASPTFKTQWFSNKVTKDGFQKAPYVRFNNKDLLQHNFLAKYYKLDAEQLPFHSLPSSMGFVEWIKLGMGWGLAPKAQIQGSLIRGDLVELVPETTLKIPLYWHIWGMDTKLTRSLSKALRQAADKAHD